MIRPCRKPLSSCRRETATLVVVTDALPSGYDHDPAPAATRAAHRIATPLTITKRGLPARVRKP